MMFDSLACASSCVTCLGKKKSLFKDLNEQELALLDQDRSRVSYCPEEIIFKEGTKPSGLFCLKSGKVKIVRTGAYGNDQIVNLKRPVEFFGLNALLSQTNYTTSAIALEDSQVCILEKKHFIKLLKDNSNLSFKIMKFLARELSGVEKHLVNISQKHMRARMAGVILFLHDFYGVNLADNSLHGRLKRADLAAFSNMTTANAIRTLSAFGKEELIKLEKTKNLYSQPTKA